MQGQTVCELRDRESGGTPISTTELKIRPYPTPYSPLHSISIPARSTLIARVNINKVIGPCFLQPAWIEAFRIHASVEVSVLALISSKQTVSFMLSMLVLALTEESERIGRRSVEGVLVVEVSPA